MDARPALKPALLYSALGGARGCHALATAFYAEVARDPILRPLFPSTFTCAIEEFSAFLVQFLGGEAEATQRRWWLSLRESHSRFAIGGREKEAWMRAMTATLGNAAVIADEAVREELLRFFGHAATHVARQEVAAPLDGELAGLWAEQLALDEAVALMRMPDRVERCIERLESAPLRERFARSPSVHAGVLALAMRSGIASLRNYALRQAQAEPSLVHERYRGGRTLLHDAAAAGDAGFAEELIALGARVDADDEKSPLYCLANECGTPGAGPMVGPLLGRNAGALNAAYGVKQCTPLHMAARRGNVELIEALVEAGAAIEARDSAGETPLRRAVNCGKVEAAKVLLARGANPASRGSRGLTPALAARSAAMKTLFEP